MPNSTVAEALQLGRSDTRGWLHIRLTDAVRSRYRRSGAMQDGYELVLEKRRGIKVKRAGKDGRVLSLAERLRHWGLRRLTVISNQPVISSMLPTLITLPDALLGPSEAWRLLAFDVEWKVESAEQFHQFFLRRAGRHRAVVTEYDVLAAVSATMRDEWLFALQQAAAHLLAGQVPAAIDWTSLAETVAAAVNRRIAHTGVSIRRFYPPSHATRAAGTQENSSDGKAADPAEQIAVGIRDLRSTLRLDPGKTTFDNLHEAVAGGLLAHLGQSAQNDCEWLTDILYTGDFDLTWNEVTQAIQAPVAAPEVIPVLKQAGYAQLRAANRTHPQDAERRSELRAKARCFFELALLIAPVVPLPAGAEAKRNKQAQRELRSLVDSLGDQDRSQSTQIAIPPGSTIYLMAVAPAVGSAESRSIDDNAHGSPGLQLVSEIIPLVEPYAAVSGRTALWSPPAAAKMLDFVGASEAISLVLQVLDPGAAAMVSRLPLVETVGPLPQDSSPAVEQPGTGLFWQWSVRTLADEFSVRLRPSAKTGAYLVELDGAEFLDPQPVRSAAYPKQAQLRLRYEPVEIALLIDGYWLANETEQTDNPQSTSHLLVDLLDGLDALENLTQRGMLIYAAICLDEHVTPRFVEAYGKPPVLWTLGSDPIDNATQFVAEWITPWLERWHAWEIKPFPVDTDIALEQGFHYLRQIEWRTRAPEQRALLVLGRSRPHEHAGSFGAGPSGALGATAATAGPQQIPYHPADRFSVTDLDWRRELAAVRKNVGTVVALCDPGLPDARHRLPSHHPLLFEYQQFWAAVDPGTLLDCDDNQDTMSAAHGRDRVISALDEQLFHRRALLHCEPPLALPVAPPSMLPASLTAGEV